MEEAVKRRKTVDESSESKTRPDVTRRSNGKDTNTATANAVARYHRKKANVTREALKRDRVGNGKLRLDGEE